MIGKIGIIVSTISVLAISILLYNYYAEAKNCKDKGGIPLDSYFAVECLMCDDIVDRNQCRFLTK